MDTFRKLKPALLITFSLAIGSCGNNSERADAYGNFESDEITISAEANGKLMAFAVEEGRTITPGENVGLIDTSQLFIQKMRLQAAIASVRSKTMDVESEIAVYREQKANLEREYARVQKLFESEAATQKQVDDLKGQLDVVNKQLNAAETRLRRTNGGILSEIEPLNWQIKQLEDQIRKSQIINPVDGIVIAKYVEKDEVVGFGIPLYKIANLKKVFLRAYISETQLASVKVGQSVQVLIDDQNDGKEYSGTVTWISDVAEFTPKVIQTRDERVNLVYAMKVAIENDGSIKLGMPGEVWLQGS